MLIPPPPPLVLCSKAETVPATRYLAPLIFPIFALVLESTLPEAPKSCSPRTALISFRSKTWKALVLANSEANMSCSS